MMDNKSTSQQVHTSTSDAPGREDRPERTDVFCAACGRILHTLRYAAASDVQNLMDTHLDRCPELLQIRDQATAIVKRLDPRVWKKGATPPQAAPPPPPRLHDVTSALPSPAREIIVLERAVHEALRRELLTPDQLRQLVGAAIDSFRSAGGAT